MSLLTFGLGISGLTGGGGSEVDVELEEPDTVIVAELDATNVEMQDADFIVKVVQKITEVTKE